MILNSPKSIPLKPGNGLKTISWKILKKGSNPHKIADFSFGRGCGGNLFFLMFPQEIEVKNVNICKPKKQGFINLSFTFVNYTGILLTNVYVQNPSMYVCYVFFVNITLQNIFFAKIDDGGKKTFTFVNA